MKKKKSSSLLDVQMDTQTRFASNGDIQIYPCSWERDKTVNDSFSPVRYRANVRVDEDGYTSVKKVREGQNGPRYDLLFSSENSDVMKTREMNHGNRGNLRMLFQYPRRHSTELIISEFKQDVKKVLAFLESNKDENLWQK